MVIDSSFYKTCYEIHNRITDSLFADTCFLGRMRPHTIKLSMSEKISIYEGNSDRI